MTSIMQPCGKVAYPSSSAAWRAIHALNHPAALFSHKRIHRKTTTYRCSTCHCWHITHQSSLKRPTPRDALRDAKYLNNRQLLWEETL